MLDRITIHVAPTERAEAEFVVHSIEQLIGGHSFFSIDSGRTANGAMANLSFSDLAVLYRTEAQSAALCEAFARSGMPYSKHSHERLMGQPGVHALMRVFDDLPIDESADHALESRLLAAAARVAGQDAGLMRRWLGGALTAHDSGAALRWRYHRFLESAAQATEADL
jgi:DNA helicase-2/ATP-dependent DNA helicase PcrA